MDTTFIAKELLDKLGAEGQQRATSIVHNAWKGQAHYKCIRQTNSGLTGRNICRLYKNAEVVASPSEPPNKHVRFLKDDDLPRNYWDLSCLVEASADSDGLVRKVKVTLADPNLT